MENIDVDFGQQHNTRHQVLQKYATALKQLRDYAEQTYRLRPYVFDSYVLFHYFQQQQQQSRDGGDGVAMSEDVEFTSFSPMTFLKLELLNHILDRRRQIFFWLLYLLLAVLCVFIYRHESSAVVGERSVQSFVYPGMRMWRRMTLPIIERFPRLTELYDESCLMGNPFFQMDYLGCAACSHVQSVLDLTLSEATADESIHKTTPSEFVPFVFKIKQDPIELNDFYTVYASNSKIFQRDAYRVQSTSRDITNLAELFDQFNHTMKTQTHNLWRCNRMLPARLLRQLIGRPAGLPSSLALERFMAIDTPQAQAYTLPDTECPNVYVQQALGTRFIILRPTNECRHLCRTLSMRLPQSFVLSYNWWYWKPISTPDPLSDSVSLSLIGSYC